MSNLSSLAFAAFTLIAPGIAHAQSPDAADTESAAMIHVAF